MDDAGDGLRGADVRADRRDGVGGRVGYEEGVGTVDDGGAGNGDGEEEEELGGVDKGQNVWDDVLRPALRLVALIFEEGAEDRKGHIEDLRCERAEEALWMVRVVGDNEGDGLKVLCVSPLLGSVLVWFGLGFLRRLMG